MATKKETKKTIGAGEFEYTKDEVKESKEYVENFESDYELSMFLNYHHEFKPKVTFLSHADSLLTFFNQHVKFENKSKDEILSFIKDNNQELRDMFLVKANKINEENPLYYESSYELDEDFHLIRKIQFDNNPEFQVIAATFLFADMVCSLWKKYNKDDINYKINTLNIQIDYCRDGENIETEEGVFPREFYSWDDFV